MAVDPRRIRLLGERAGAGFAPGAGPVVYWMSRDQRADDNWALLYAQELALAHRRPLAVVFTLAPAFLEAEPRHYAFMLAGLAEVERRLAALNVALVVLQGEPAETLPRWLAANEAAFVVADFSPLRLPRRWRETVARDFPVAEVDAHNVVPAWVASPKLEFGAYTLRPKLRRLLPEFLTPIPAPVAHPFAWTAPPRAVDWRAITRSMGAAGGYGWIRPGPAAAGAALAGFLESKLAGYAEGRNDPNRDAVSGLSPYLHFGQLAPQRAAWETQRYDGAVASQEAFLEELVVRRELSDNFCLYQPAYDAWAGFPRWARETLDAHRADAREARYDYDRLAAGQTGEPLWDAAQRRLVREGRMHGYLRMYWAKQLLRWTASPEEALAVGIRLNDRYALDGRDPNGYAGVAWSIGGVHDRAWFERPIFGKIRYMNENGAKRKFDVAAYLAQ